RVLSSPGQGKARLAGAGRRPDEPQPAERVRHVRADGPGARGEGVNGHHRPATPNAGRPRVAAELATRWQVRQTMRFIVGDRPARQVSPDTQSGTLVGTQPG